MEVDGSTLRLSFLLNENIFDIPEGDEKQTVVIEQNISVVYSVFRRRLLSSETENLGVGMFFFIERPKEENEQSTEVTTVQDNDQAANGKLVFHETEYHFNLINGCSM